MNTLMQIAVVALVIRVFGADIKNIINWIKEKTK